MWAITVVATGVLCNCHPLWSILYRCEQEENWNITHWQDAPEPTLFKCSSVLLESLFDILNKTEVSSLLFRGQVSRPQKPIMTPSMPNRQLMVQQTDFYYELSITRTYTHTLYLQLKHVNRSARKNLLWQLFHLVDNLDLKFLQLTPFSSIQLSTTDKKRQRK